MQEFLNPKSMLTPGIAGTLMMFLVNGIVGQFPELSPRYTGLLLSFAIGGTVFISESIAGAMLYLKGLLWILNSLIVFVVGFGASHIAADAANKVAANIERPVYSFQIIRSANAQVTRNQPATGQAPTRTKPAAEPARADSQGSAREQLERERRENALLRQKIMQLEMVTKQTSEVQKKDVFFQKW